MDKMACFRGFYGAPSQFHFARNETFYDFRLLTELMIYSQRTINLIFMYKIVNAGKKK